MSARAKRARSTSTALLAVASLPFLVVVVVALGACATDAEQEVVRTKRPAPRVVIEPERPPEPRPIERPIARAPSSVGAMRLHLIDVGQGAATLLEFPCAAMLVDTGGEQNELFDAVPALTEYLDGFFADRPDLDRTLALLVITHPHIDHLRGVPALLERYRVLNVVDDGLPGDDLVATPMAALRALEDTGGIGRRAIVTELLPEGDAFSDDVVDPIVCPGVDPRIRVLWGGVTADPGWGENRYGHAHYTNANNHSVVVRVDYGQSSVLITGDLEDVGIRALMARLSDRRLLDADVYVVGHHGSYNGTTRALLEAVTPDIALISMGAASREISWSAWQYGHPRKDIVEMLTTTVRRGRRHVNAPVARGARRFEDTRIDRAIYGTGWDGTVVVKLLASGAILVEDARPRAASLVVPARDDGAHAHP